MSVGQSEGRQCPQQKRLNEKQKQRKTKIEIITKHRTEQNKINERFNSAEQEMSVVFHQRKQVDNFNGKKVQLKQSNKTLD